MLIKKSNIKWNKIGFLLIGIFTSATLNFVRVGLSKEASKQTQSKTPTVQALTVKNPSAQTYRNGYYACSTYNQDALFAYSNGSGPTSNAEAGGCYDQNHNLLDFCAYVPINESFNVKCRVAWNNEELRKDLAESFNTCNNFITHYGSGAGCTMDVLTTFITRGTFNRTEGNRGFTFENNGVPLPGVSGRGSDRFPMPNDREDYDTIICVNDGNGGYEKTLSDLASHCLQAGNNVKDVIDPSMLIKGTAQ